jgi:hypothetical protein
LVGDVAKGVLLLECEPCGQASEPFTSPGESGATLTGVVLRGYSPDEFTGTPINRTVRSIDDLAKCGYPVLSDERIGILRARQKAGLEHAKSGRMS